MAPLRLTSRMGLFALLLSVVALSLFASLVAADRALVRSQREVAELDSRQSALVAAGELRRRAEALALFLDPVLPGYRADTIRPPAGFERVWVVSATGAIAFASPPMAPGDSAAAIALAGSAAAIGEATVTVSTDSAPFLHVVVPLSHRGQRLGVAIGALRAADLVTMLHSHASGRTAVALRASGRTVATSGPEPDSDAIAAAEPIPLPGQPIELVVMRSEEGQWVRRLLWMLGVLALAGLAAALARERRQAASLAERTTELERLYQEVARSNRMKSEFLANVSHELRTPLNAIVGFVDMLRDGVYGDLNPRQALPVDRIAASATHLRQLVDRLLDIAKIAAGRLEIHAEPVTLRPFVLNVASEMESLVTERGLRLSVSVPPTLPRITTDQTHLRQILINLIGNAVKYTTSGEVRVHAARVASAGSDNGVPAAPGRPPLGGHHWVAVMVSDTGLGIAPEDQERIFDEFEQVNAGARTDSARRGTGLGLAISRRLARHLGGDVTVSSAPGQGSTFVVWLPLDPDYQPPAVSL